MTAFSWHVRNRYATGLSADPDVGTLAVFLPWSANVAFAGQSLPWNDVGEYPSLMILGIGFDLVTDGTAGNRQIRIQVGQPAFGITTFFSTGVQAAGLTRRWEFAAGFALDTTTVGAVGYKEPLPSGLILLSPHNPTASEGQLVVSVLGTLGPADNMGPVTVYGALLFP